ncbi:MAG: hypothetical protein ACF8XB_16220 [Planctomycetota bacterium JB042]
MRGPKKHPLEIFRSSGRKLGEGGQRPPETDVEPTAPEPPMQAERPPSEEFQLVLTLNGGLILLFAWVVLMGAAYLFGYGRGAASERGGRDEAALAKGEEIAAGTSVEEAAEVASGARRPYGVLIVTYPEAAWHEQFKELRGTLRERYGVTDLTSWLRGGKVEVMAGAFRSKDDPRLAELAGTIRRISDWPHGNNERPFSSAYVKMHPDDPANARRATNRQETE